MNHKIWQEKSSLASVAGCKVCVPYWVSQTPITQNYKTLITAEFYYSHISFLF